RLDEARGVAALVRTRMLGDVGRGAAVLAAEREALGETQGDEEDRRRPADRREARQQADQERRAAHHHDGDEEGVLAADQVADASEDQRTEWPHGKPDAEEREAGEEASGF